MVAQFIKNIFKTKKKTLRHEFLAELFGCAVLIAFGNGVVAARNMQKGKYADVTDGGMAPEDYADSLFVNVTWGLAVTFGVMVSFDTSGAHLNPAVTMINMIFNGMPTKQGLVYIAAQFCGCFTGALIVAIDYVAFKGVDALSNVYCTGPFGATHNAANEVLVQGVNWGNAFFNECIGAALLLMGILAITNGRPAFNKFHVAGFVGALVFAIGNAFGVSTGYAINPARDFAPRMVWLLFAGAYSKGDYYTTVMGDGYFWIPIVAPLVGAFCGTVFYKLLTNAGDDFEEGDVLDRQEFKLEEGSNSKMSVSE